MPSRGASEPSPPGRRAVGLRHQRDHHCGHRSSRRAAAGRRDVLVRARTGRAHRNRSRRRARPPTGATPLTTPARPGACGGFRSTRVAPSVVMAAPVAMPCSTRATSSTPTFPAATNSSSEVASRAIARGEYRPATDEVGERAEQQQRADQAEHVDREDDGQDGRREAPLLLVDHVQRGGRGRRGHEDHEDDADRGERERTGQPTLLPVDRNAGTSPWLVRWRARSSCS